MPELPEVETIRRQLSEHLPFKVLNVRQSAGFKLNILHTSLNIKNKTIVEIKRKGKVLDFVMNDQSHILSHLGMTGTWLIGTQPKLGKHSHLILKNEQLTLAYDDPRRFGHLYYLNQKEADHKLSQLGTDLLDFKLEDLASALNRYPHRQLKVTLLDQKLFAGSGNYIANEICAHARLLPTRLISSLNQLDMKRILAAISKVLNPAIHSGGTTFQGGYRDSTGEKGKGLEHLVVFYQKTCGLCHVNPIQKIILAQRGTYYCNHCQV